MFQRIIHYDNYRIDKFSYICQRLKKNSPDVTVKNFWKLIFQKKDVGQCTILDENKSNLTAIHGFMEKPVPVDILYKLGPYNPIFEKVTISNDAVQQEYDGAICEIYNVHKEQITMYEEKKMIITEFEIVVFENITEISGIEFVERQKYDTEKEKIISSEYDILMEIDPEKDDDIIDFISVVNDTKYDILTIENKNNVIQGYENLTKTTEFISVDLVQLTKENRKLITDDKYLWSYKADGLKTFLFCHDKMLYFINDGMKIFSTNIELNFDGFIIEGELIDNEDADMYLAFDCLFFDNKDVRSLPFFDAGTCRFRCAQTIIEKIKQIMLETDDTSTNLLFKMKDFMSCEYQKMTDDMYNDNKPKDYPVDGIIFMPKNIPYPIKKLGERTHWLELIKWKPDDKFTVDFRIQFDKNLSGWKKEVGGKYVCKVFTGGMMVPYKYNGKELLMYIDKTQRCIHDKSFLYDDGVYEIIVDSDSKLTPYKYRADKYHDDPLKANANKLRTANAIMESCKHHMTLTEYMQMTKSSDAATDTYYEAQNLEIKAKMMPMTHVHNQIIKEMLYKQSVFFATGIPDYTGKLSCTEFGCGQGGDLPRWNRYFYRVNAIDSSWNNIYGQDIGIKSLTSRLLSGTYRVKVNPVVMDLSNAQVYDVPDNHAAYDKMMKDYSSNVSVANMMIHYFFDKEESLDTLIDLIVKTNCKTILITYIDEKFFKMEEEKGFIDGTEMWHFRLGSKLDGIFGRKVFVYNSHIKESDEICEYIVHEPTLFSKFEKHGYKLGMKYYFKNVFEDFKDTPQVIEELKIPDLVKYTSKFVGVILNKI